MTATAAIGVDHTCALWNPAIDNEVASQYALGLGLSHLADITGKPRRGLARMIAETGTPVRHRHARPDPEIMLWEADPVLLASVLHKQDIIARPRSSNDPALGARSLALLGRDTSRLLGRVDSLPAAERADAMLRLLIACPYAPDHSTLDALTRAGVVAAEQGSPQAAAAIYGWVALLHATTGTWEQAHQHHSAIATHLHDRHVENGANPNGDEVHARWRHAALLAAAGDHEVAMRALTDLDLVLGRLAEAHERIARARSLEDGFAHAALERARARNHAALGTQALCANNTQITIDALKCACDLVAYLQAHPHDPVLHPILRLFEQCTVLFALGYARGQQQAGTGRYELHPAPIS